MPEQSTLLSFVERRSTAARKLPRGVVLLFCDYAWRRVSVGFCAAGEKGQWDNSLLGLRKTGAAEEAARRLGLLRADTERDDVRRFPSRE